MKKVFADFLLLLAALVWGSTFVFQKIATEHIDAFLFNGLRFLLASFVVYIGYLVLRIVQKKAKTPAIKYNTKIHTQKTNIHYILFVSKNGTSLIGGLLLAVGINVQQIALQFTSVGKAGFLTGLYVVIVPIIGLFIKHKITIPQWISVAMAAVGIYFISIHEVFTLVFGDTLLIIGAVVWALYILYVSRVSKKVNIFSFAMRQYFYCGLMSMMCAIPYLIFKEEFQTYNFVANTGEFIFTLWDQTQSVWLPILYSAILSTALGFSLQIYAQRYAPPSHASVILSLEAVFAAIFGVLILNEMFSGREYVGIVIIFSAMILSQVMNLKQK